MHISFTDISNRENKLSLKNMPRSENLSNIRLVNESNNTVFESNAINMICNWESLDEDSNIAYDKALNALDALIEFGDNQSVINTQVDFLSEASSKVRNPSQLKNSLKYRMSRIKSKISTDLNKEHKDNKDDVPNSMSNINSKRPYGANGQKQTPDNKEEAVSEAYETLIESAAKNAECDRIIKNYSSIHSRYNIDSLITNCADNKLSIYEAVNRITFYVDTFNSPFKNRYNTALETAWYGLNKKFILCENSEIVDAVTDYYVFNGGLSESEVEDIKSISTISNIFTDKDFDCISYLDSDIVPDETVSKADVDYYGMDYDTFNMVNNFKESAIDKIVGIERKNNGEGNTEHIFKLLDEFKSNVNKNMDSDTNLMTLNAFIDKIINECPEEIPHAIAKIMAIIKVSFILYTSDTSKMTKVSSILKNLINAVINIPADQSQATTMLNYITAEITNMNNRIKNTDEVPNKDNIEKYIKILNDLKESIEQYITTTFSEKESDSKEYEFDDSTEQEETENDIEEDGLKEAATIILISNLMESVSDGLYDNDVTSVICGNVEKFNVDTLDSIVDFSVTVPDIVNKEKLQEALEAHRDKLRENASIPDYIRIDAINDNLSKLSEARLYNTYNDPKGIIAYLMCLDELNKININEPSKYFTEAMSFTNTLKLALNNLKRKAVNLSEKEKQASATLDSSMNHIIQKMDKQMSAADREAVARGSILPSASKCIKIALVLGAAAWAIHPAVAIIGALGVYFCRKNATHKERQIALDEIEIELKMCERYMRIYEDKQDMEAIRQCEIIQRNLQRQYQRIKYKMKVDFKHADTSSASIKTSTGDSYS